MNVHPYILGVLIGDGCLSIYPARGDYRIQLSCVDMEFADAFYQALSSVIPRVKRKYYAPSCSGRGNRDNTKWQHRIVAWNKEFALILQRLLKILQDSVELMTNDELAQLVKGFYDSEGSYYGGKQTSSLVGEFRHHRITMYNTNRDYISIINRALERLGYRAKTYKYGTCYMIRLTHREDVNRFFKEIGTSIPRKNGGEVQVQWRVQNLVHPKAMGEELRKRGIEI